MAKCNLCTEIWVSADFIDPVIYVCPKCRNYKNLTHRENLELMIRAIVRNELSKWLGGIKIE